MQHLPTLEYGEYYHIFNRGNNREDIFREERNYEYFLSSLFHHLEKSIDVFAYCLLKNHFHLLVHIKSANHQHAHTNPQQQFSNFFNGYAKAINKAYGRSGSLFQKRFGRKVITSQQYLVRSVCYIHCNPEIHGFVEDFRKYPHSSYHTILDNSISRITTDEVLEWFGGVKALEEQHHTYIKNRDFTGVDQEPD